MIREQLKTAFFIFFILTIITGIIYPLAITAVAQIFFHNQANGSLIVRDGSIIGSELIGQSFDDTKYFWSRPSATSPEPFNASSSSGANLGPSNPALLDNIKAHIVKLQKADPNNLLSIPVDLVTSSASGLDPQISPAAAHYQLPRVARERRMQEDTVRALIEKNTDGRFLGIIGEPVVNVLKLNLALDEAQKVQRQ